MDPQGNRTLLQDPDNKRTVYVYDELNRLETLTLDAGTPAQQVVRYEYFADGLKQRVENPNGTTSTYQYDAADRMTDIAHVGPTGIVSSYQYTYDANGNREQQVETNASRTETTTYDYDLVNRLTRATYPEKTVQYEYDPAGNRTREITTGAENSDKVYAYDAINRLLSIDSNVDTEDVAYQYDPNGNTTSKSKNGVTTTFHYDIRDQLGEVRESGNVLGRYGYDFDGRRILKIGNEGRRQYTYDQLSVITEADQANATVSKYDYGLDQLVRLDNRNEGRSFFHLDFLGSTVNLTDQVGGSRQSTFFDAWGNERDRIGSSANKFTFTGHELDEETGLIYARARFYDPNIGRFITQDSLLGDVMNAPSLHRYIYALDNPTVFIDPTGFISEKSKGQKLDEALQRRVDAGEITRNDAILMGVFFRTEAVERAQGNAVVAGVVVVSGGTFGIGVTATTFATAAAFDQGHQIFVEGKDVSELDFERSFRVGGIAAPIAGVAGVGLTVGGATTLVTTGVVGGVTVVGATEGSLNVLEGVQEGDIGKTAFGTVEVATSVIGARALVKNLSGSNVTGVVAESVPPATPSKSSKVNLLNDLGSTKQPLSVNPKEPSLGSGLSRPTPEAQALHQRINFRGVQDTLRRNASESVKFAQGTPRANGRFGTKAHGEFERLNILSNEKLRGTGFKIRVEEFRGSSPSKGIPGPVVSRRAAQSKGLDAVVEYLNKPLFAFDLKTGRGFSSSAVVELQDRFQIPILELR